MKIPNSVRIGGVEYKIVTTPFLNNGLQIAYGHIDYEKCIIELSETIEMAHEKKCLVLLHEILHGIRNNYGFEMENEEEIVDVFARGLYQVLQDNGGRLFDIEKADKE